MFEKWLNEKFIAHRGYHTDNISENTLNAFQNAINHGFNIELDVQPTSDNVAVVYHDTNMGRLTNCKEFVEDISYEFLKNKVRYDKTGENIPTFSEAAKLCEGKTGLMIEIKKRTYATKEIRVEPLVYDILKSYKGDFVVKSFNPFSVQWFLDHAPEFTVGFLSEYDSLDDYDEESRKLVEKFLFDGKTAGVSVPAISSGVAAGKRKVDFFDYAVTKIGSPLWNSVYGTMPCYTWVVRDRATQKRVKNVTQNIIFENYDPRK